MSGSKEELLELLKNHIDESNKKHDRTYSKLEQQDSTLSTILIQAQKTNGRVLSLEASREEMKNSLKDQDQTLKSHSKTIWGVSAVISAFMFIGGFFYKTTTDNLKYELKEELYQGLETLLDERVSGVYLER